MGYVTNENWFEVKDADPYNEQVAAAASASLEVFLGMTHRALDEAFAQGATEVEAMAVMAYSMKETLEEGSLGLDTVVNALCLALV